MSYLSLHPDDLPSESSASEDQELRRKLEESVGRRFYGMCDGVTQALLINCEWYISNSADALTLVIECPDQVVNWRVLNNVTALGQRLAQFSLKARIRICPPEGEGAPFVIRVDELSMFQDTL